MTAYIFFTVLALTVLSSALLWLPWPLTWRRGLAGSAAALVVIGGWALLAFGQDWLVITHRDAHAALRFGLDDQASAVLVAAEGPSPEEVRWTRRPGGLSPHVLADADAGVEIHDPTLAAGLLLRLDLVEEGLLVRTIGDGDRVFVAGTAVATPGVVDVPRGSSILRWGASELEVRRESLLRRFMPTLLLLGALVLWAGVAAAERPAAPAWVAGLALGGLGTILHARFGCDQVLPTMSGFRMAVAMTAAMALTGVILHLDPSLRRRRQIAFGALVLALATVASVSGEAIVGSPSGIVVGALVAVIVAVGSVGLLPGIGCWLRARVAQPRALVIAAVMVLAPILMLVFGRVRAIEDLPVSGRFLLAVLLFWAWAHLVETLPLPPARSWVSPRTLLLVAPWLVISGLAAAADTGFGFALAGALLAAPVAAAPDHRLRSLALLLPVGTFLAAVAFYLGKLPHRAIDRILAVPNWMYGMGSGQMASARLLTQEGGLWGEAWGGPVRIRLPEYDADLIVSALTFEIGALGLFLTALLFVSLCAGLLLAAARCDFERDRDASRHVLLFVAGGVTFMALLASFNLAGTVGLLPLTGVPILLLSRSGDGVLAVVLLMAAVSVATEERCQGTFNVRRDMRVVAAAVVVVSLIPFLAAAAVAGATGLAWLLEPQARWIAFDEHPLLGPVARLERTEGTAGGVAFVLEVLADGEVALNGQPLEAGSRRTLMRDDEIVFGHMRLVLVDDLFDPRLELAGWILPSGTEATIGRINYHDHLWWFEAPTINLAWDTRADLHVARLESGEEGWALVPDGNAYDGLRDQGGSPLNSARGLVADGSVTVVRAGRTDLAMTVLADHRLRVDLRSPRRSFALSKMDGTYLGGGRIGRSFAYRQRLLEDRRLQAGLRVLIENGLVREVVGGIEVDQAAAREGHASAVDEVRRFCGVEDRGASFTIHESRLDRLGDGRVAGLAMTEVRRRLARPVEMEAPLVVLDRQGREIADPWVLGLGAVWGTRSSSALPGLNSLAPSLVVHQEERDRLSPFYPLTGFDEPRVYPLRVWLDIDAQRAVMEALAEWAEHWKNTVADRGISDPELADLVAGVVVVDDQNHILALGSTPSLSGPQEMVEVLNAGSYDPRLSVLSLEEVATGSTMKIAVWSYLLENAPDYFFERDGQLYFKTWERQAGQLVPRLFRCTGVVDHFAGRSVPPIVNSPNQAWGLAPLSVNVAKSLNTFTAVALGYMGAEGLDQMVVFAEDLGMFRRFDLLPGELRDPGQGWEQWLRWSGRHPVLEPFSPQAYGGLDGGADAARPLAGRMRFHLGNLSRVSGLNVVVAFNAIINGGVFYAPSLIRGLGATASAGHDFAPSRPERVMTPEVAEHLTGLLAGVVSSSSGVRGTAAAVFADSPLLAGGHDLVGKTGTHQRQRLDSRRRLVPDRSDKVFVGSCRPYPSQSSGRITVFVYGRKAGPHGNGTSGIDSQGAMRTARRILEALSGYEPST